MNIINHQRVQRFTIAALLLMCAPPLIFAAAHVAAWTLPPPTPLLLTAAWCLGTLACIAAVYLWILEPLWKHPPSETD